MVAIVSLPPCVQAQQQIGYVVDIDGKWLLDKQPPQALSKGQQLPAGGVIRIVSPSKNNYITIVSLSGDLIAHRQCDNPGDCDRPIRLGRDTKPQSSSVGGVMDAVMNLIWGEPDRYSVHRVRGGELPDGVVQLRDGQVDLGPVFKKREKDRYYLRFLTIPHDGKPASRKSLGPITFDWDPAKPSAIPINDLKPGLYELGLLERDGEEYVPTNITAWVLVSKPGEYGKATSSFQQAKTLTEKWGKDVKPQSVRSFLRAHLDHLAKEAAR